jgi:hypothetical protein
MATPTAGRELGGNNQSTERNESAVHSQGRKIFEPTDRDVLFGRGNGSTMHNHSSNYRELIMSHKLEYQKEGQHNNIKRDITTRIVESVKANGGRFLKPHKGTDGTIKHWFEVDNKKAFVKTMDALRVKKDSKNSTSASATLLDHKEEIRAMEPHNVSGNIDKNDDRGPSQNSGIQLQTILASCAGLDDTSFSELLHWYLPELEGARRISSRPSNPIQGVGASFSQIFQNSNVHAVESLAQTTSNNVHETAAQIAILIPKIQESKQSCLGMLQELEPQVTRFKIMLENLIAWQTWYHGQHTHHRGQEVIE